MTEQSTEPMTAEELAAEVERLKQESIAFRGNIRNVAMKYAKQHNLCGVVEQALREAGLDDQRVRVSVTTTVPTTLTLDMPVDLVGDKDDAALTAAILDWVAHPTADRHRAWRSVRTVRTVRGEATGTTIERNVAPTNSLDGYVQRYSGYDGRKAHYVEESRLTEESRYNIVSSLCGRVENYPQNWHEQPQNRRSEGLCNSCNQAVQRRGMVP